jgi:hypothetical protein
MHYLTLATAINKKGRRDGDYFCSEMFRGKSVWLKENLITTIGHDKLKARKAPARRAAVREAIEQFGGNSHLDVFAIFGHGLWNALPAAGYNNWNVRDLAHTLSRVTQEIKIILYCCSCGRGKGQFKKPDIKLPSTNIAEVPGKAGWAMRLAGALQEMGLGFEIFAHTTAGKTAKNPFLVRIYQDEDFSIVREQVVPYVSKWQRHNDPAGRRRWVAWQDLVRNDPVFRFQFPFLNQGDIDALVGEKK